MVFFSPFMKSEDVGREVRANMLRNFIYDSQEQGFLEDSEAMQPIPRSSKKTRGAKGATQLASQRES
jgi:hypothetical protein